MTARGRGSHMCDEIMSDLFSAVVRHRQRRQQAKRGNVTGLVLSTEKASDDIVLDSLPHTPGKYSLAQAKPGANPWARVLSVWQCLSHLLLSLASS